MKKIKDYLPLIFLVGMVVLSLSSSVDADYKMNPFTRKLDYYESGSVPPSYSNVSALAADGSGSSVIYKPISSIATVGTVTLNNVSSLWAAQGGHQTIIAETATTPGYTQEIVFSGVVSFNSISMKIWYDGTGTDSVQVQSWDYSLGIWETYNTIPRNTTYEWKPTAIIDSTNHISNGYVRIRLYHPDLGKTNHTIYLDYAVLSSLSGGQNLTAYATNAALGNATTSFRAADAAIKAFTTHTSANDNIIDSSWQSAEAAAGDTSAFNVLNATRYWSGITGAEQRNTWHVWIGHSNFVCRTADAPWETSVPRQTFDILRTNTFASSSTTWIYYHPYMADATRWNGNYTTIVPFAGVAGRPTHREINLSYNGAKLQDYTSTGRINDTFHNVSSLDALTIMLGINDAYTVTTAQRTSMLQTIIDKLKTKFSNTDLEVNIINEPGRVANTGGAYNPALYLGEGNVYAAALLNTGLVDARRAYDLWDPQHLHFLTEDDGSKRVHLDEVACEWIAKMYARAMSPQGLTPALTTSPWVKTDTFTNYSARKAAGIRPAVEAVNSYAFTNNSGITNLSIDSTNNRIGIRTAAPTSVLDINVSNAEYSSVLTSLSYDSIITKNAAVTQWWVGAISSGLSCAAFTGVGMRGTLTSPTTLNENDIPFTISVRGFDGTTINGAAAQIRAKVDGAVSTGVMPVGWYIKTGSGASAADRLGIHSDGDVTVYRRAKFSNSSTFATMPDGTKIVFYPMSSAAKGKTFTWERRAW